MSTKKLTTFCLLFIMIFACGMCLAIAQPFASASSTNDVTAIVSNIVQAETHVVTDSFEIYGNQPNMHENDFRKIVEDGAEKIYLHYQTGIINTVFYNALLCIKTPEKTYQYEFKEAESNDSNTITNHIKSFVQAKLNDWISNQYVSNQNAVATTSDIPTTFINCVVEKEYTTRFDTLGYIVYHIAISRYVVNADSIIFIATVNTSFVPGNVARINNDKSYGIYHNYAGYVHMTVEQAYDSKEEYYYGKRWGNIPYKKDYWPVNIPSTVSITSSIQAGITLGYSFTNGFSKDGISISTDRNIGANISFGYSKTITHSDPALTVQPASSNNNTVQWSHKYSKYSGVDETHHQQTNYMFEISNSRKEMFIGEFRLLLDLQLNVKNGGISRIRTFSRDLFVSAYEYSRICDFDDGMF